MLEELLGLVAQGGAHSYEDLTEQLAITQPLLEAMLEDLARLGYLRSLGGVCPGVCTSCSVGSCAVTGPGRLWSLTEKGTRVASQF